MKQNMRKRSPLAVLLALCLAMQLCVPAAMASNRLMRAGDAAIEQIEEDVVPKLSDGDYTDAAETFLSLCADTLDFYAEQGEPLDVDNDPGSSLGVFGVVLVVGISMLAAAIVCGVLCSRMKTAVEKTEANDYMPDYGLDLTVKEDRYLRTARTQVYDPPPPPPSESGGSSTDSDGFGGSSGGSF